jgi:hypothetical protein
MTTNTVCGHEQELQDSVWIILPSGKWSAFCDLECVRHWCELLAIGTVLITRAECVSLKVSAEGDNLVIKGPRSAETVAQELLVNKPAVMAALE